MKLKIKIKHPEIFLFLIVKKEVVDKICWRDDNDMSKRLLSAIDTLLKKNKMDVADLKKIEVSSDQRSYTSTRIAKTVAKTVGYCLT